MNKEEMKSIFSPFTCSLHTHVRSQFDAQIEAERLTDRIIALGGKGCAITDHGVLSSIEDYRPAFKAAGLKLIPGCELYVDGGILGRLHLIVLATNDTGYKGISKIVTEANRNTDVIGNAQFAVITKEKLFEIMKDYKGDIIALSACMQGVICSIFRINSDIEKKIGKLKKKQSAYISKDSESYKIAVRNLSIAEQNLADVISLRDKTKAQAEQKFNRREAAIKKADTNGEDVTELIKELENDKLIAAQAIEKLGRLKESVTIAKKELSEEKANVKDLEEKAKKYDELNDEIVDLARTLKTDAEIWNIALREANQYRDSFGADCFYAEIQYHGIAEEKTCFLGLLKVARELNIPLVATNDVHILTNSDDDRLRRCILRSLRYSNDVFEEENAGDSELYLKDNYELADSLLKIFPQDAVIEAIQNIDVIFDRCNVEFETGKHYPKFADDANKILEEEIEKGIKWRFPDGLDETHKKRLEHELPIIESMGYADYHLVVKDFLEYGRLLGYVPKEKLAEAPLTIDELKEYIKENGWKNQGMLIGPGRGSAVGSLVCYLLGITALDPLKYDLLFERFLNPERISMPDIDSDISNTTRAKVIEYVKHKYGNMAVCGIMTTNALAPKGAIEIAAKYYGIKKDGNSLMAIGRMINKDIPADVGTSFNSIVDNSGKIASDGMSLKKYLLEKYVDNEDAVNIIKWGIILEGSFTSYGSHAAGIVISDNSDVSEYLPLRWNTNMGMFTTQCDMVQVEDNGLLKFDFLGLKTLDIITDAIRMIENNTGKIIDVLKIDLADSNVYKNILSEGKTNSVFQFESDGMKTMLKRFKPETFEDLIILVSMFRPGPLQYLDGVIDVKNGKKEMTFLCPELEPILGKTYGAIVYQEQVMEICQKLAGYTLGGADTVRRYMSKKKADKLAHEREKFVTGCKANGINEDISNELFNQMMDFASYAFNKSHAAVYAFNAYITAWLKYYYPAEFFASALNWCDKNVKIAGLMNEAKLSGVKVYAPSINKSKEDFYVVNGEIRFGLSLVKGVNNQAKDIISERANGKYSSLKDFIYRVNPKSTVIEHLIDAGALDEFSDNRASLKVMAEEIKKPIANLRKKESFIRSAELCLPYVEKLSVEDIIKLQEDNNYAVEIKESITADKLTKKLENAKTSEAAIRKELNAIKFHKIDEDKDSRMALEKEYLGMYVTKHPMDFYPDASELNTDNICNVNDDTLVLYGVISGIDVKKRKKDGAEMGFFTLEDKTGIIKCIAFVKQYSKNKALIADGNVVLIKGRTNVETLDDGTTEYSFLAEEMKKVEPKSAAILVQVSSYASFHVDIEDKFMKMYCVTNGRKLYIHDRLLDEVREMNYQVSDKVLELKNATELF